MRAAFVRTVGAKDRIYVTRDDGSETSWSFASYGDALPHDLVHFVVEAMLGVTRGVWGRVAAGGDLQAMNAAAEQTGGKRKYDAAFGGDLDELLRAETLANAPWLRDDETLDRGGLAGFLPGIEATQIAAVRARLLDLRARWRTLVPRGAITLDWPSLTER